ncbi:sialin-like [Macrobrachium rosenbergii]|uniref:sialin-like n=1 Tax=Macrobrachium rosenbergii TaxID=79674 RepID=UPI0034D7B24E
MKMENSGALGGHCNKGAQFDDEDDVSSSKDRGRVSSISTEVTKQGDILSIPQPKGWGCRHTLVVLGFTGLCVTYLNRTNLSIAIVGMVAVNSSSSAGNNSEICPFPPDWNATSRDATNEGEFHWDEATQGILLGCFFYGYAVSNFFGGLAVERYGSRLVMTFSVFLSSLVSIISPICARTSIGLFIGARVLSGLAQGPAFPCMHNLLVTWNPPQDRACFASVLFQARSLLCLGGLMNESTSRGWPSIFYVFGILGILWCIPWLIFMRDSPQKHPRISKEELRYIEANGSTVRTTMRMKVPWREIFTSVPYWTLIVIAWGGSFGFYTFLTEIPTYLKNIQHFGSADVRELGLPNEYRGSNIFVSLCKGMYVPSLSLVAMCFVNCNSTLAIIVLCLSVGISACSDLGGALSEQDMAPNLTAALKGITNAVGAVSGIVAPLITGLVTSNNQTIGAWRTVFLTTSVTYFVSCTVFLLFGTSKVQPWNFPKEEKEKEKKQALNPRVIYT